MFLRFVLCVLLLPAVMMYLVWCQMRAADKVGWLTEEQVGELGHEPGLSFDRHYAMPLDFAVIAPFVGLVVFICWPQWARWDIILTGVWALVITVPMCFMWWRLPGAEAHNRSPEAAVYHGWFMVIAVWALIMLFAMTKRPTPGLLLVADIIVPAFLFVGQHMYLGLINNGGSAKTYNQQPLKNVGGWVILVVVTAILWWRSTALIPQTFWDSIR